MRDVETQHIAQVCKALIGSTSRSAVKIIDGLFVVRATWRYKPDRRHMRRELVVTFGAPNYRERQLIKSGVTYGKTYLRAWPKRSV